MCSHLTFKPKEKETENKVKDEKKHEKILHFKQIFIFFTSLKVLLDKNLCMSLKKKSRLVRFSYILLYQDDGMLVSGTETLSVNF